MKPTITTLIDGRRYFEATLTVGLPPLLQETYVSAVYTHSQMYTIETSSLNSQKFDSLKSFWQLSNIVDATSLENCNSNKNLYDTNRQTIQEQQQPCTGVHFTVEMTVSDPIIAATLDQVLEKVAKQQVHAFAQRCQQIPYIPPSQ
jgi:ribosome-associated toxin RatA of RatAB toxin-antitoxin module